MNVEIVEQAAAIEQSIQEAQSDIVVTDADSYTFAANAIKVYDAILDRIDEVVGPAVESAHKTHKELCKLREGLKERVLGMRTEADESMRRWRKEEDAKREEAESKLNESLAYEQMKLIESGDMEAAAMTPIDVPVASTVPNLQGIHFVRHYKAKIVDETKIPREYMMPDEKKIGELARKFKEEAPAFCPGIEVYFTESTVNRRK